MRHQKFDIVREFEFDPSDIQAAFYAVAEKRYGKDSFFGPRYKIFFRYPVTLITIKTGPGQNTQGVSGSVGVRGLPGFFIVTPEGHPLIAGCDVGENEKARAQDFLDKVEQHLQTSSIYRGKALTALKDFLDLSGVSFDDVVYNEKVLRDLRAHVWTIIEKAAQCRDLGLVPPRKVLFEGPFGSGKTLAALLTAQIAIKNGWTFIYVPPGEKSHRTLESAMQFACRYQPAVMFIEDIDREQLAGDPHAAGAIQMAIDGIASKNAHVVTIMTTNYSDRIMAAMQRPGRTDKIIRFGLYTAADIQKLLARTIPANLLDPAVSWNEITDACAGFPPAFVKETGKSSLLFALSEEGQAVSRVTTAMLVEAARDLQSQYNKLKEAIGFAAK